MFELIGILKIKIKKKKKNRMNFIERKQFYCGEKEKNRKNELEGKNNRRKE